MRRDLKTLRSPDDNWEKGLGAENMLDFVASVLTESPSQLAFILDDVDRVFDFPDISDDFFGMIRVWHDLRATNAQWKQLDIVIAHSTEPYLWIRNPNRSPLNVGHTVRALDFTRPEIEWLSDQYGRSSLKQGGVDQLISLLAGHPYLVRRAIHELRAGTLTLAQLIERAADNDGPFIDHLRRFAWQIRRWPKLQRSLKQIIAAGRTDDDPSFESLLAAGLVKGTRQSAQPRCELFQRYFAVHLA
jgi:hypothetical protein